MTKYTIDDLTKEMKTTKPFSNRDLEGSEQYKFNYFLVNKIIELTNKNIELEERVKELENEQ